MVWIIQFILGLERRDLEHRGQRRMMQDWRTRRRNGAMWERLGVRPCVEGGRIRQCTTATGASIVYGDEVFEYGARSSVWFRGGTVG